MLRKLIFLKLATMALLTSAAAAQGQDGTRAEKNLQVLSAILPGVYDNANQAYFDRRLKLPDDAQHTGMHVEISKTDTNTPSFSIDLSKGPEDEDRTQHALTMHFRLTEARDQVISNISAMDGSTNCQFTWGLVGEQFVGRKLSTGCSAENHPTLNALNEIIVSQNELWLDFDDDTHNHFALERARVFECYVDVPGVGGGRDIPFERFFIKNIHDKGGNEDIKLANGDNINIRLQNIRWPMNNEIGNFTRHSFVMYVTYTPADGSKPKESYTWTIPQAPRIGMNLKTLLSNCYLISNRDVEPYMRLEPFPTDDFIPLR